MECKETGISRCERSAIAAIPVLHCTTLLTHHSSTMTSLPSSMKAIIADGVSSVPLPPRRVHPFSPRRKAARRWTKSPSRS